MLGTARGRVAVPGALGSPQRRGVLRSQLSAFPVKCRSQDIGLLLTPGFRRWTRQSERGRAAFQEMPGFRGRSCRRRTHLLTEITARLQTHLSEQRAQKCISIFFILFLFILKPSRPLLLHSSECVNCPTTFFLTFHGNFQDFPLCPSPLAPLPGTSALRTGTPLLSPPALWPCSMLKQLLLCILLIIISKSIFPEEQDCPQATAVAVELVPCRARAGCLQSQK